MTKWLTLSVAFSRTDSRMKWPKPKNIGLDWVLVMFFSLLCVSCGDLNQAIIHSSIHSFYDMMLSFCFSVAFVSLLNQVKSKILTHHLVPPQVIHEFLCEIEQSKQNFLLQTATDTTCCLFTDATKIMNTDDRRCVRHGGICDTW